MLPKHEKLTVEQVQADIERHTEVAEWLLGMLHGQLYHRKYVRKFYDSVTAVKNAESRLLWHLQGDQDNDTGAN
jgi:hypothetical protein